MEARTGLGFQTGSLPMWWAFGVSSSYEPSWSVPARFFFFQAEDGIRDLTVTGVQTCALPISSACRSRPSKSCIRPPSRSGTDAPTELAFAGPPSDTVRYEDDLGEFETRLLLDRKSVV